MPRKGLIAAIALALSAGAHAQEWRERATYLCDWRSNQPVQDANAPDLSFCSSPADRYTEASVKREMLTFWDFWRSAHPDKDMKRWFEVDFIREHPKIAKARAAADRAKREKKLAAEATSLDPIALCSYFHSSRSEVARKELERRNALTPREWTLVRSKEIAIGISEAALICSWGPTRRNRTIRADQVDIQYVYGSSYVYVTNGVVSAFQD